MEMRVRRGAIFARGGWIGAVLLLLFFTVSCAASRSTTADSSKGSSRVEPPSILGERLRADQVERSVGEGSAVPAAATPAAAQAARVLEVTGVQVQGPAGAGATILVTADGLLSDYESFALPDPPRLVIDLPHARHAIPQPVALPAGSPILKVRTTQYRERPVPIVRLVFDLAHLLPYRLEMTGNQMQILVSEEASEGTRPPQALERDEKAVKAQQPAGAQGLPEPVAITQMSPAAVETALPPGQPVAPPAGKEEEKKEETKPPEVAQAAAEKTAPGTVEPPAQPSQIEKQELPGTSPQMAEGAGQESMKAASTYAGAQAARAVRVTGVQVQAGAAGATILVTADGLLSDYKSFALPDPPRLVIDLPHARHAISQPVALPAGSPILKVRSTQYRVRPISIVRLVFDLGQALPFRTEKIEYGLRIFLGEPPQESAPPPAVAEAPQKEAAPKVKRPTPQKPPSPAVAKRTKRERRRAPSKEAPKLAEIPPPAPAPEQQAIPTPPAPPRTPVGNNRISLDFKGADLDDLLRLISEVSGLNVVAAHGLTDRKARDVTIRLISVEWRQALDIILRAKNLSYEQDGNLIYVGSKSDIQKAKLERAEDIRKAEEANKKMEQEARLREIQIEEEKRKAESEKRNAEEARKKAEEEERLYAEEPKCTKLIQLAHTKASEIKKHLDPLKTRRGSVELDERTNTVIVNDVQSACLKMAAVAKELDAPPKDPFVTKLLPFNYAKAADLRINLAALKTPQGTVVVDERSSRVIIKDLPPAVERMESLLKQIDIPTPQVLIEARIIEATRTFSQSLGVQWGGAGVATSPGRSTGVTAFGGNASQIQFPNPQVPGTTPPFFDPTNPIPFLGPVPLALNLPAIASGANPFVLGATIGSLANRYLVGLQLSAAEREGRIRTLSSPRVATQDNEEAEIKQGTQVPFTTIDSSGRTIVSFQDAFIKLKVKPHITPDGRVSMKVEAERSFAGEKVDFTGGFVFPINTRKATTNILVPNGSTVVIGGLLQSTEGVVVDQVPFLGRIPILGWLFKRQSLGPDERVELLIFLTPSVLQESRL